MKRLRDVIQDSILKKIKSLKGDKTNAKKIEALQEQLKYYQKPKRKVP